MADCFLRAVQFLAEERQVVMAVSEIRVAPERHLIGFYGFRLALHIVQQDGKIEQQHRVVAVCCKRFPVHLLRLRQLPGFV